YQKHVGFSFLKLEPDKEKGELPAVTPKILDTSIIIDGRIIDIAQTGFIEGPMIVPNFVLREIQLISDSEDPIKRNRGRRGLDMLNELQKRDDLTVKIVYTDYTDTREVDAKLVKLAREMGGKLLTNDFNLNKVAKLQDVQVLNINQLANALKPVVLPGEQMDLQIVKEGKDENQGIGYLEDGTMVVVENGGKLVGKKVKVEVTSVLQTNAGKMIFTKVLPK
ncbi:MAG: TRAM domain-containing protein, partial [Candidatus Hydrogenedentota bacterium]